MKSYKIGSNEYRSGYAASVALAKQGMSNKDISKTLGITPQSVSASLKRETIREFHLMDKGEIDTKAPEVVKEKGRKAKGSK
jgi:predicted transcriptional regulator